MGRLRRKRPASAKKKRQKKAAQDNNRQRHTTQAQAAQPAVESRPVLEQAAPAKKETPKAIKPSGRKFELTFWKKSTQFLREVKVELKKVTWPSRKETVASTGVVLILVIIVSAFLGLVDAGLSSLIRFALR